MKKIDVVKKIKSLPIINKAENAWVDKKYQPYSLELVELKKVLEIIYGEEINSKSVSQFSKDKKLIKTYNSIIEAAIETGVNKSSISKCCRLKQVSAGGYEWRYNEKNVKIL